jgi:hypothetical protein
MWFELSVSDGSCSYIDMCIDAVANSVMLQLYLHDFYNIIIKIKHKLCIAPGFSRPCPPIPHWEILGPRLYMLLIWRLWTLSFFTLWVRLICSTDGLTIPHLTHGVASILCFTTEEFGGGSVEYEGTWIIFISKYKDKEIRYLQDIGFYDGDDSCCLLGYDTVQSGVYQHCEGPYCFHLQGRRGSFFRQNVGTHLTRYMSISEDHGTNAVLKLYSDWLLPLD